MRQSRGFKGVVAVAVLAVSGCMSGTTSRDAEVTRAAPAEPATALSAAQAEAAESQIIETLMERRSALSPNSSFDRVAAAVLAANSRAAEAELRSARLRAQAASKNWLPTLGPQVSLTSLSNIIATLVIDQVLFDNGRKKAERAFAKADVEVAAVTLAQDTNDRVHTALSLFLDAQQARDKARLATQSARDMGHFAWIMEERVRGGVSDMSDLNVLRQKLAEIEAERTAQTEAAAAAMAELNAMAANPLDGVSGIAPVSLSVSSVDPLSVILAEAEKARAIEAARIDRADHLPGLSASAAIGSGATDPALRVTSEKPLGLGTGASLRAIDAATEAAERKVGQAREDANRRLRRLEQEAQALARQAGEAAAMTGAAKRNLDLFQAQYDAGQRQVMDVVGVYETYARQQEQEVTLAYDAVRRKLDIARDLGLLADGGRI